MQLIKYEKKIIKLSELVFDKDNPNKMSSDEKKALKESFKKFGYVQQIIVDKTTNMIADGEHRAKELIELGITEAEVIFYPFKDDIERKLFRQVANKLHGQHNPELDAEEFRRILSETEMEDLVKLTAISEQEILALLNAVEAEENKPKTAEIDKLYHQEVTCPKCGFVFKKANE